MTRKIRLSELKRIIGSEVTRLVEMSEQRFARKVVDDALETSEQFAALWRKTEHQIARYIDGGDQHDPRDYIPTLAANLTRLVVSEYHLSPNDKADVRGYIEDELWDLCDPNNDGGCA